MSRNWSIVEQVDGVVGRAVEQGLSKRRARKLVPQWQEASDRNRVMVARLAPASPLPVVVYRAVSS